MRKSIILGLAASSIMAAPALAQHANHNHTLDAQMQQRMQQKQVAPVYQQNPMYRKAMPSAGAYVQGSGAIPALPLEIRTVGDVRYLTGGIGDEEEAQLEMVKQDYSFRMLMTAEGGAYIGDATVRIMDSAGNLVLSTDGAGPYLYATLAPGKYKVEAVTEEGARKEANVIVPKTGFTKPVMRF